MTKAKVRQFGDQVALPGFRLEKSGLVADGSPLFEQWEATGKILVGLSGSVHWAIGDWLNYGERRYGEKYTEALEATGFDCQTLRDDKWVASRFELSRRRDNLSWSHHKAVAVLDDRQRDDLLDAAESERWSEKELRQRVRERSIDLLVANFCARIVKFSPSTKSIHLRRWGSIDKEGTSILRNLGKHFKPPVPILLGCTAP